jgi:signal transduction histidine kinase
VDLMGHDISNLNHAIMGYLELAMDMLDLKKDEKELIARPIELINNSTSLINNVKKLKRLKTGVLQKKIMDLGQVMEEVKLQNANVTGRGVVINYMPVNGCRVMADEMLKDVFSNLVENAIKHSQGALTVNMGLIRTYGDGQIFYKAIVEDNGPGMPDELKNRVLDRLYPVKLEAMGRGMGLCVAKALVDSYNGKISVEDRVPGDHKKGCRFVVILPATDQ